MINSKNNKHNFITFINKPNKHCRNFIQFTIKKGNKEVIEKNLRKSLYFVAKNNKTNFWRDLNIAVKKTTIHFNVKIKRYGSKNVYIPVKIKNSYSTFLSYNWILTNVNKCNENKFYKKFVNEISDIVDDRSSIIKKKIEIYKLVEENINNVWKK